MPLIGGSTASRRLLVAALVSLLTVATAAVGVVVLAKGSGDGSAGGSATGLTGTAGAPTDPAVIRVRSGQGRFVTCPVGSRPAVKLVSVRFIPALAGGTHMRRGTYRIVARGVVANETTRPIDVTWVRATVEGAAWRAKIHRPSALAAGQQGAVVITGWYRSLRYQQARLATALTWVWHAQSLRRCGSRGLITDD